ncbi:phage holin family protein [Fictibacillus fluitans]|uniref:Phage holin family protein n=1 Tax=Fictibacillus fluitans TaxID=3058422 RepID=A0ABT8HU92_9BACL|nr:phage holin family protein [Fictibacillus sp. NE201]MDN4524347.1 phage holin family protein [Fictibacillus sp. NE201]
MLTFLLQYLNQHSLFLIPALLVIGFGLRRAPFLKKEYVFWVFLGISVLLSFWNFGVNIHSFANGIINAGAVHGALSLIKKFNL